MKKTAAKKVTRFKKSLSKSNSSTSARKTPRVKAPIVDLAVEIEDTYLPKPEDEMTVQKP